MSSRRTPRRAVRAALLTTAVLAALGGVAVAADEGEPTVISVSPRVVIAAGRTAPPTSRASRRRGPGSRCRAATPPSRATSASPAVARSRSPRCG